MEPITGSVCAVALEEGLPRTRLLFSADAWLHRIMIKRPPAG